MARILIVGGRVYVESGERVGVVAGKVFQDAVAAAGGGLSIPIAAYHYNHNTGSKL